MNRRTCSDCRYEKEDANSEVCTNCHGIIKGEPSNWENKSCLVCVNFGKGVHVKPCKDCIYNKYKPSFELDKKENKEMEGIKTCDNGEARNKTEGNNSDTKLIRCAVCRYRYKDMDAEPCNKCSNNDCISKETRATLSLCFEEPESKQEDEELQEEIASHDSKQEVYNGVTPSCWTCKHFEDNSNDAPCSKCVAICNGITSYWEERDEEIGLQTAREVVEKTVEQRLQEEHFDEHYHDKVQPLEIMQEIMTPEEFRGFLFGNIIKYSCRCGKKDEPQKEFAKLRRYREWYDKAVLGEHIDPRV